MTLKCNKKRCLQCKKQMILHGFTKSGKQRYRCKHCSKTNTKKRGDVSRRRDANIVRKWIIKH